MEYFGYSRPSCCLQNIEFLTRSGAFVEADASTLHDVSLKISAS